MVESIIVMVMACLVFFSVFQYANLLSARLVLTHAATRAARAKTVGLNHWMVEKSARAAAIPVSGKCLTEFPDAPVNTGAMLLNRGSQGRVWNAALRSSPRSARAQFELARIPDYMDSENSPTSEEILNYERWRSLTVSVDEPLDFDGTSPGQLSVTVRQGQPLLISLLALSQGELRATDGDEMRVRGAYSIESHYPLYMENMNW